MNSDENKKDGEKIVAVTYFNNEKVLITISIEEFIKLLENNKGNISTKMMPLLKTNKGNIFGIFDYKTLYIDGNNVLRLVHNAQENINIQIGKVSINYTQKDVSVSCNNTSIPCSLDNNTSNLCTEEQIREILLNDIKVENLEVYIKSYKRALEVCEMLKPLRENGFSCVPIKELQNLIDNGTLSDIDRIKRINVLIGNITKFRANDRALNRIEQTYVDFTGLTPKTGEETYQVNPYALLLE